MNYFLRLLMLQLLCAVGASALEWRETHQVLKAAPLQSTAAISFAYTNRGDRPVSITRVDTSCDCLDAEPSVTVVAPGETGKINARFTVAGLSGVFHRTITVTSDDVPQPVALTVQLEVPEVATLTPRSLEWKLAGSSETKVVEITLADGLELTLGEVRPTHAVFTTRLETVAPGRHYRLLVTPTDTSQAISAALRIHAATATGRAIIFSAYGNIR